MTAHEAAPEEPGVLRTPEGLRFRVVKGVPEGEEAELLALAIDRLAARERDREVRPWATNLRPGIGVRAYEPGSRWAHSLRSTWGRDL
jgi:hypothetical protein